MNLITVGGVNMTDSQSKNGDLIHVHVCLDCGAVIRRETFEGRALTSGIFTCPKCGSEGPLNVEIRTTDDIVD